MSGKSTLSPGIAMAALHFARGLAKGAQPALAEDSDD